MRQRASAFWKRKLPGRFGYASCHDDLISFTVAGGQSFTTVIYDATAGGTAGATTYTLTVSLSSCSSAPGFVPGLGLRLLRSPGAQLEWPTRSHSRLRAAVARTSFRCPEVCLQGLSFSGNTLSGTPSEAGTFPITVSAADPAGRPTGTQGYSLVIDGHHSSVAGGLCRGPANRYAGHELSYCLAGHC